jgi:hypothetical protein
MGSGYRVFTAGEVLTASNVQNFLQNQSVMSFADSTARATSIGTANFEEGMVSYLQNTDQLELYNGTAWASIAPTSTQGLTLINSTSFSGVATQSVNDVFSATYRNYRIVASVRCSTDTDFYVRWRVGGSDLSSSNSYYWGGVHIGVTSSQTLAGFNQTLDTKIYLGAIGGWNGTVTFDVTAPFIAEKTSMTGISGLRTNLTFAGSTNNIETSYTGFSLIPGAGNLTGVVNVYGYNA